MSGRLERLLEQATPGPWKWKKDGTLRGKSQNAIVNPEQQAGEPQ